MGPRGENSPLRSTPQVQREGSAGLLTPTALRREGRKQEIARLFKVMTHEDLVASDIDHDGRVDEAEFVLL